MRRNLFALTLLLGSGCIAGTAAVERDDRVLRELARQERWAQQAIDARPTREQLDSIRGSDYGSVGAARKELQKLILSIDRGTWVRDTTAEMLRDDPNDPQLLQEFDRGGKLRIAALQGADELADALAEAHGGLTIADLRPGFEALRKAQASEDRLSRLAGPLKLAASPIPVPQPFLDAAAKLLDQNPDMVKDLDKLPPQDATKIRAKLSDLDRGKEEQKRAAEPPPAVVENDKAPLPPPAASPGEREAEAPSTTLKIAGDAASLIAKKPPRSITLREDGLFALSYDDADYLVDPNGKLVRKEQPAQR